MKSQALTKDEYQLLRVYIEESCGISLGDAKEYLIESRLTSLVEEAGCRTFKDFYLKAKNEPQSGLRDKIVDAMTTNETLWFRDRYPFEILKAAIFPQYKEEAQGGKKRMVRIWSAACSTGQEAYSTVMTMMEFAKTQTVLTPANLEILATDISPSALYIASAGNYDVFAMNRGLSKAHKDLYFENKGRFWSIKNEVKKPVTFKNFNLKESFLSLGKFDVIFCRNVAIYFSAEFKKNLFSKIAKSLNPGGYFFLGASESLSGHSSHFEMLNHNGGIYYKVKG